jgi:hypothetical protein
MDESVVAPASCVSTLLLLLLVVAVSDRNNNDDDDGGGGAAARRKAAATLVRKARQLQRLATATASRDTVMPIFILRGYKNKSTHVRGAPIEIP